MVDNEIDTRLSVTDSRKSQYNIIVLLSRPVAGHNYWAYIDSVGELNFFKLSIYNQRSLS